MYLTDKLAVQRVGDTSSRVIDVENGRSDLDDDG